jgi:prepilin-type N-terminal cleavage/methylation domain-containing protein
MKITFAKAGLHATGARGMTLVEVMIAAALGSMLLAAAGSLWLFGSRSFLAMGNYSDLDKKSRAALDRMSQDIRQATAVTAFEKTKTARLLAVTNAVAGVGMTYIWEASSRRLICQKTGQAKEVYLTECDRWDFEFYQRTPQSGGSYAFYPATNAAGAYDLSICKLLDMSWKCSRSIMGKQENTESVQTAQVVLRNKQ